MSQDPEPRFMPPPPKSDPVSTLIPYKNRHALTAYYCGVFSLIPVVGLVLGPVALGLGVMGLNFVKANPAAKGTGHAITGIVLGAITTLFNWSLALMALLEGGMSALGLR